MFACVDSSQQRNNSGTVESTPETIHLGIISIIIRSNRSSINERIHSRCVHRCDYALYAKLTLMIVVDNGAVEIKWLIIRVCTHFGAWMLVVLCEQ